jgi:hypothetical protein
MICFAGPQAITSWQPESEEQKGYLCAFSHEFLISGRKTNICLDELPFFRIDGHSVIHLSDEQTRDFLFLFELMHIEHDRQTFHSAHILRSTLQLLIQRPSQ